MTSPRRVPIFDGHNDVLFRLFRRGGTDAPRAFLEGEGKGQLDFPMARQGGFAGGLFAIFVPSANGAIGPNAEVPSQNASSGAALPPALELMPAQRAVFAMVSLLLRIERESQGRVRVCRNVNDIQEAMEDGLLAPVMHIEGAEAIDPNFEVLDLLYEAGLRSLGPVWSRSNSDARFSAAVCAYAIWHSQKRCGPIPRDFSVRQRSKIDDDQQVHFQLRRRG